MAYTDILELTPEFGLSESIRFNTNITEAESGLERRDALWDHGLREYNLTVQFLSQASMNDIWNFYIARKGSYDDFLIKILTEFQSVDPFTGNGSNTVFLLHNFPVDTTAHNSVTVGGVPNSNYTLSNDFANEKSYITFSVAPSGAILASYEFYMRMRFKEDTLTRQLVAYQLLNAGVAMVEVRWNSYVPAGGNSSSSSSSSSSMSSSSSSSSRSSSSSSSSSSSRSSSSSSSSKSSSSSSSKSSSSSSST